jgi:hypothetical protein
MYFPLSQISTNLNTNGNEFIYVSSKQPYVGFYWKTSTGKFYTGKTPQDVPVEELIPFSPEGKSNLLPPTITKNGDSFYNQNDISSLTYLNLKSPSSPGRLPVYSPSIPTQQDYQIGEFRRYFCKKSNEIIYLEIDKDTYDKLVGQDSKILYQLYQPFNLPWQLTGNKDQVYKVNKNITELTSVRQRLPMLSEYLKMDFTKYYI